MMKNKLKQVVTVVVTFNRKELLKECLMALKNQEYQNVKVLIIDNASTDGTKEYINDLIDNKTFIYFNTGENLGGAGGFNYGIKQALKIGCDYVWVMDDDCIVQKDSLSKLIEFSDSVDDNFGYLSSYVKWKDGSVCNMNIQRTSIKSEIKDFSKNQKIKLASFVSLFIKSSVIEDVGLPIKEFFIWGDDWEYTSRISRKYNCYFVSNSIVTHKSNSNMGVDISKDSSDRLDRYFYAYRNEGYFYNKEGIKGKFYFFLKKNLHVFRILFSKSKNKKKKLGILFKGARAVKSFKPEIEYVSHNEKPSSNKGDTNEK